MATNEANNCVVQPVHAWTRLCRHVRPCFSVWQGLRFFTLDQPTVEALLNELPGFKLHQMEDEVTSQWGIAPPLTPSPHRLSFCRVLIQPFPCFPDLSVFSRRLHRNRHISHSSSGKHHVDSGLCPEIRQYALTEKKHNKQTWRFSHTCTFARRGPIVTPRQRRQTAAAEGSCVSVWRASVWNSGTIWALHCWQNSLRDISTHHLHIWKTLKKLLSLSFAVSKVPSSICVVPGGALKRICKVIHFLSFGNDSDMQLEEIPWCSYLAAAPCC